MSPHARKTITGIEVNEGEVTTVNVALQQKTFGLEEITVTARANSSGEAGLLSLQKKATAVQDGLSSEMLSKTGDSDVAEAMKRVTGVTVRNGQDVFVRGLGNRYSNVQLNGAQVPSTNPEQEGGSHRPLRQWTH
ncbi:MAG: TonB-dependent receptor plug domain-containing protein [Balneolaceae bacterium]|nr:TonB-dependent receptor plug domain-containing protein [Balneolaceae bacterium]